MKLHDLTIHELHDLFRRKEATSREATASVLQRIRETDPKVNAYITVLEKEAMAQADRADTRIRGGGDFGPLCGIPLAVKDVISLEGAPCTCGSRILKTYLPPYDATVIRRLKESDAVFVGKTNMDEFAMGSSTENSFAGPSHNPWNLEYVTGGSSGGSAAAVAADECLGALGTDTGGSIRQPACFCGVAGLKPTYGRVSRYGMVAFACSLEQIGPIAKDVRDLALLMNGIAGYDPLDSTSVNLAVPDFCADLGKDLKGLRAGVPKEYFPEGLDPEVEASLQAAMKTLESMGVTLDEVSLSYNDYAIAAYYIIAPAEAGSNLARYDGVKYGYRTPDAKDLREMYRKTRTEGFGPEVIRRIMLGTYVLSAGYYDAFYRKACQVRTLIVEQFKRVLQDVDFLVTPVSPTPAFRIGEKIDDPLTMYLTDVFTLAVNLAGVPGVSVPCGFTRSGLPIGVQFIGRHFDEGTILRVAHQFEQGADFHRTRPTL